MKNLVWNDILYLDGPIYAHKDDLFIWRHMQPCCAPSFTKTDKYFHESFIIKVFTYDPHPLEQYSDLNQIIYASLVPLCAQIASIALLSISDRVNHKIIFKFYHFLLFSNLLPTVTWYHCFTLTIRLQRSREFSRELTISCSI